MTRATKHDKSDKITHLELDFRTRESLSCTAKTQKHKGDASLVKSGEHERASARLTSRMDRTSSTPGSVLFGIISISASRVFQTTWTHRKRSVQPIRTITGTMIAATHSMMIGCGMMSVLYVMESKSVVLFKKLAVLRGKKKRESRDNRG